MVGGRRWLAGIAAGAVLALALAVAVGNAGPAQPALPSSYSAGPAGLLALFRLLAQQGTTVGWRTGPALPAAGTLVGAAGPAPPDRAAVADLLAWVREGHRAVLLGSVPALATALGVTEAIDALPGARAQAAVALPGLRGAGRVVVPGGVLLIPPPGAVVLYTLGPGHAPAALRLALGRGRIDWIGSASIWSNAALARYPGNIVLADNLLDDGQPVWFDEYWFGAARTRQAPAPLRTPLGTAGRPHPLPLPQGWPVAALTLAAAAGAALWSAGWRRHPVRPVPEAAPSALDELRARADLRFRTAARGNHDDG